MAAFCPHIGLSEERSECEKQFLSMMRGHRGTASFTKPERPNEGTQILREEWANF